MIATLIGAAMLAPAPAARFAPPLNQWVTHVLEETRDDAGARTQFRLTRRVRFSAEGAGFLAEVETLGADGGVGDGPGALFESAMAAFRGTTIRLHLDADGAVQSIDDQAAVMARLRDAIVAAATSRAAPADRAALAARLAAPLTAMPEAMQRQMLGSMISSLIDEPDQPLTATLPEAVTRQGASPYGGLAQLTGTRRRWIDATGAVVVETALSGTAQAGKGGGTASITVNTRDTIDPATRLVMVSKTTRRAVLDDKVSVIETQSTLSLRP